MFDVIAPLWLVMGIALPVGLMLLAMALIAQPWRKSAAPARTAVAWNLGIGSAMLTGIAATFGPPRLGMLLNTSPHLRWQDGLSLVVAMAVAMELVRAARGGVGRRAWRWPTALAAAVPWLLLLPIIRHEWSLGQTLAWTIGSTGGLLVWLMAGRIGAAGRPGHDRPLALGVVSLAAGLTIAMSGSISIGQLAVTLGAALIAGAMLAWVGRPRAGHGTPVAALLLYGCILIVGYHYTYNAAAGREGLRGLEAILLACAPLMNSMGRLPLLRRFDGVTLRIVLTLVPAAIALTLTTLRFAAS